MEPQTNAGQAERPQDFKPAARAALAVRFSIDSEFLRVADLARMLSVSGNCVRAQIRQGRFPMPHRKIGSAILVKFDDFLDWHCAEAPGAALPAASGPGAASGSSEPEGSPACAPRETPSERVGRIKCEMRDVARATAAAGAPAKRKSAVGSAPT